MRFKPESIKDIRIKEGMTLEAMAEKTGISKQVLSTWETGACEPRISTLIRFSTAMDVPFDFFFSGIITTVISQNKVDSN